MSLSCMSEDRLVKPADRARLKGCYNKWTQAKCILGCAFFVDLLTPCTTVSKSMQNDEINIIGALTGVLKTLKETDKHRGTNWCSQNTEGDRQAGFKASRSMADICSYHK